MYIMDSLLQLNESIEHNNQEINLDVMTSNIGIQCCDTSNLFYQHHLITANSLDLNAQTSLSDDSGVPLTNSSISSGDSYRLGLCKFELELVESDGEVSQFDSLDNCSEGGMSAENFNTLKKGPLAPIDPPPEFQDSPQTTLLRSPALQNFAFKLSEDLITTAISHWSSNSSLTTLDETVSEQKPKFINHTNRLMIQIPNNLYDKHIYASDSLLSKQNDNIYDEPNDSCYTSQRNRYDNNNEKSAKLINHSSYFKTIKSETDSSKSIKLNFSRLSDIHDYDLYYGHKNDSFQQRKTPLLYSPLHHHTGNSVTSSNRPNSRNSLNSRLSSSHNSLSVSNANKADDSIFITQAMSHDALLGREISDFYNVPVDSDIYAFPIDMIKTEAKDSPKRLEQGKHQKCRMKYIRNNKRKKSNHITEATGIEKYASRIKNRSEDKRHSVPESSIEPLHMTLDEVKQFYHTLYSSSSDSNENVHKVILTQSRKSVNNVLKNNERNCSLQLNSQPLLKPNLKNQSKVKKISTKTETNLTNNDKYSTTNEKKSQFSINLNLKQKFCSIFRFRKNNSRQHLIDTSNYISNRTDDTHNNIGIDEKKKKFSTRALPPLPNKKNTNDSLEEDKLKKLDKKIEFNSAIHFASNIEKVKNYGWYWGPISSETAEKILSNEPDGSFIVRDSSDDHYIFSLSFKLNNCVRHVRIDQDQGTFSFGSYAKFKSQTITEFIEKAVEHSRSGRYLFFLHRRPEHGPMRVQLTNPVSRFKHIQSLQHMCRFVILKAVVRKDLIASLPLPRRLLDYLSYKHCYSEQVDSDSSQSQMSGDGRT